MLGRGGGGAQEGLGGDLGEEGVLTPKINKKEKIETTHEAPLENTIRGRQDASY